MVAEHIDKSLKENFSQPNLSLSVFCLWGGMKRTIQSVLFVNLSCFISDFLVSNEIIHIQITSLIFCVSSTVHNTNPSIHQFDFWAFYAFSLLVFSVGLYSSLTKQKFSAGAVWLLLWVSYLDFSINHQPIKQSSLLLLICGIIFSFGFWRQCSVYSSFVLRCSRFGLCDGIDEARDARTRMIPICVFSVCYFIELNWLGLFFIILVSLCS